MPQPQQEKRPELSRRMHTMMLVAECQSISVLVGFSALIAAVGRVNTLSLGVAQRHAGCSGCCAPWASRPDSYAG